MAQRRGRWATTIMATLATGALGLSGSVTRAGAEVRYADEKLWVAVDNVPAATVFAAVSEKTGMEIVVPDHLAGALVSLRSPGLPVDSAIVRLLRAAGVASYVLTYDRDGRAQRLLVLDRTGASASGRDSGELRFMPRPEGRGSGELAPMPPPAGRDAGELPPMLRPMAEADTRPANRLVTPDEVRSLREQIASWKALSPADRQVVLERVSQLPLDQRIAVYRRRPAVRPGDAQ